MKFAICLVLIFCLSVVSAIAQEITELQDLVQEALLNNPEIKAARSSWEASTKRPSQEASLPNPVIGGRFTNVGFDDISQGTDPRSDIQVYINQEIPFPGKLVSMKKIAEQKSDARKWMYKSVENGVIAELKTSYYKWFLISKSLEITRENKNMLQDFVDVAEANYEVGNGIQQDVLKAQVELSSFIEKIELLNKKQDVIKAKINSILSRPAGKMLGSPADITEIREIKYSLDEIKQIIDEKSPELNAGIEMIGSSEESLHLARNQYMPDFLLSGTYFNRDGGNGNLDDIWQIGVGLRVPLYFWRKERPGVEEASAELVEEKENYESLKNKIYFKADDYYYSAKSSRKLIDLYNNGIIPQSRLSLESAIYSYQVGDVDFLTLLNNLVTLFNFEIEYYKNITDYLTAEAGLEEIAGVSVTEEKADSIYEYPQVESENQENIQ